MPIEFRSGSRRIKRQSGIALILVLWVLMLLSAIAGNLAYTSQTELAIARNTVGRAEAEALADAGIHRGLLELSRPQTDPQRWQANGVPHAWEFQGHSIQIAILDESARIDINHAPDALLKGLFLSQGVSDSDSDALVDAILDWRDTDDLRRVHGAEKDEYLAVGRSYVPTNGTFTTVEELRQVLGVSETLYRRLEAQLTVYSNQAGINTVIATGAVLRALPGATKEAVDLYLAQRQEALKQGIPVAPFAPGQAFAAAATNSVFSIQARVVLSDNIRFFREAVVRMTGSQREPFAILAWRSPSTPPHGGESTGGNYQQSNDR